MQTRLHRDQTFCLIKDETIMMALSFSPDGEYLATAGVDEEVNSVSFCPRGEHIVTASDDSTTRVWDIHGAQSLAHLRHTDVVNIAIFNPAGNLIASAAGDPMSGHSEIGVRLCPWKSGLNR